MLNTILEVLMILGILIVPLIAYTAFWLIRGQNHAI
jgi:hypothetical protein